VISVRDFRDFRLPDDRTCRVAVARGSASWSRLFSSRRGGKSGNPLESLHFASLCLHGTAFAKA
jgi:hypothetical protein